MAGFVQLEMRSVKQDAEGNIIETRHMGYSWFSITEQPQLYVIYSTANSTFQWVATGNYHFGPNQPEN